MAKILEMPKLSPTMEEGVLSSWHKKEGDTIVVDDLLAEVETDKATMEFRSFDRGTLLKLLVQPGAVVKLGQPVAILGEPGQNVDSLVPRAESGPADPASKPEVTPEKPEAAPAGRAPGTPASTPAVPPAPASTPEAGLLHRGSPLDRTEYEAPDAPLGGRVRASPYVRKIARDRGIALDGAVGTGKHGRVLPEDLDPLSGRSAAPTPKAAAVPSPSNEGLAEPEVRPLTQMRKAIARRLVHAKQTVPHFYLTIDVDAEALVALRESINQELASSEKTRKDGDDRAFKVSLNDLLIKASAMGLVRVPECNAQYTDDALLIHRRVDVSVAVAIPDGLVTPVVRSADQKSVVAIAREVRDLAARARARKLKPEEMTNGTFSISNLGMFGIDEFAAVINPPEGAILAVGRVRDVPVVREGGVAPGKRLSMTLSCDHRVVDGAIGAAFLAELRALLERPMRILTG